MRNRKTRFIVALMMMLFFAFSIFPSVLNAAEMYGQDSARFRYFYGNEDFLKLLNRWNTQRATEGDKEEVKPAPEEPQVPEEPQAIQGLSADEKEMLDLINKERAKVNAAPLQIDMRLVKSARAKSSDMIDNNYFSHTSPVYGGFSALIRQYAPDYSYTAENIAGAPRVETAHKNFMNSSGHRKNILNTNYTHVGIGIVDGGPYGKMFTQHFGG